MSPAALPLPHRLLDRVADLGPWPILALGLVLRLAVLVLLPDQGFPDTAAYVADGRALVETGLVQTHTYMPLYSLVAFGLGGGVFLHLFDIVLSLATIWLVRELALALASHGGTIPPQTARLGANLAALAWAAWPHALFYAVSGLTETSFTFLLCLVFLLWTRERYLWGSLAAVASILIRPTGELAYPILLAAFILVVHRRSWGLLLRQGLVLGLIYVTLMTPWWIHNHEKYGTFVRLNLGGSLVLYSGANPANTSGGGVNTDNGRSDDVDYSPFIGITDPVERDRAMTQAAVQFIHDHPGRWLTLSGKKFVRFWRLWPYAKQYTAPHIIAASLLSYGLALVGAIAFLVVGGRRHWRPLTPMLLFTGYLTAVHMATIGSIRYRFPLEPFLVVLAGLAVAWLVGSLSRRPPESATPPESRAG
ncbi:hypothetical protein [Roseospirillum parvum]|uniref:Dolichyl-phosphate-mannose-protein mannosyltransferase n=1 Tax=Roseospirillum parvum TaxID=83401 RepID=A0A1G7UZZ6_9PROT|nr:hypothetical protein [Roseospirillum parvum]SDG52699.1 hypothetical protein SAMN05421742_101480 [Roseospirillum parvum]